MSALPSLPSTGSSTPGASSAVDAALAPPTPPTPPTPSTPSAQARRTRALTLAGVVALVVLGLAWELVLARTGSGTWAIKVVPLLLPLAGLWRYRLYTYRWLSLLVWLYVCEGLVRATSEGGLSAMLAWAEVVLGLLVFVACVAHIRSRLRAGRDGEGDGRSAADQAMEPTTPHTR